MQPHPYFQAIVEAYRAAGRPFFHQGTPEEARAMFQASIAAAPPPTDLPDLARVEDHIVDGPNGAVSVRIYTPHGAVGTLVYFHSGGWVIGDIASADSTCRRLAGRAGCTVVSVEYRKAPEHPFPQPLDDAYAALEWAAADFPGPLVVGGESAGGNLAAACAIRARDTGGPALAGQWLFYPVTDADFGTKSYRDVGDKNWLLSAADMRWFWDHYAPAGVDRAQPLLSPLRVADAAGLPPAMIGVAQFDPLRDEGLAFAAKLAGDGVPVVLRSDPGMLHGYLVAAAAVPAAQEALAESARWIRARLHHGASGSMSLPDDGALIDRLYAAMTAGDLVVAEACLAPGAVVWHCFDGLEQHREEIVAGWRDLFAGFPERGVADVTREPIAGGFLQRHVFYGRTRDGTRIGWPVCLVVSVEQGRIARIDEYIDRAGRFDLTGDGPIQTPRQSGSPA